jgi:hypothetical protein
MGLEVKVLDEARGNERGTMRETDTGYSIEVMARHPGLRRVLGTRLDDGTFEHEAEPRARLALSEAVVSTIVDWLIGQEARRYPHNFPDAFSVLAQRNRSTARYLPPVQQVMAAGPTDE